MAECLTALAVKSGNSAALAILAQIHRRAFEPQGERAWSTSSFDQMLASPGCEAFLYHRQKVPVAFVLVRSVCDEAELVSLAVDPEFQSLGFARAMLVGLIDHLTNKGIAQFHLEVRQDNKKAIKLYRSCGFVKIGERRAYYQISAGKKVDAHLFCLQLR